MIIHSIPIYDHGSANSTSKSAIRTCIKQIGLAIERKLNHETEAN